MSFVDTLHERFHARVEAAVGDALRASFTPKAERTSHARARNGIPYDNDYDVVFPGKPSQTETLMGEMEVGVPAVRVSTWAVRTRSTSTDFA